MITDERNAMDENEEAHWQIASGWLVEIVDGEPVPLVEIAKLPGYRQWLDKIAPPAWSYTPEGHDDEYEYVVTAECDGTYPQTWRRTPERRTPRGDAESIPNLPHRSTRRLHDPVPGEEVRDVV